ncbi:MAG: PEGA domain-containing protein [Euryarchaeota archaeon]|nr:PEGA domain-containing protein [Euryarchaeota archaeon]
MKHIPLIAVALFILILLVAPSGCAGTGSSDRRGVCLIDGESKTIYTNGQWALQEGYVIKLVQIDLTGTKAWVVITKDGTDLDSMIIHIHDTGRFTKSIDPQELDLIISIKALNISKPAEEAILLVHQYSDGVGATRGSISIASSPEGAVIYLDDEYKSKTPGTLIGIPSGSHTIRLKKSGYDDYTETVHVSAGAETTVSVPLSISTPIHAEETHDTGEEQDNWQMTPDVATPGSMAPADAAMPAPVPGAALTIIGLMIAAIIIEMKKRL